MVLFFRWSVSPQKWSSISNSAIFRRRLLNQHCVKVWVVPKIAQDPYIFFLSPSSLKYTLLAKGLEFLMSQKTVVLCSSNQILAKGKSPKCTIIQFLIILLNSCWQYWSAVSFYLALFMMNSWKKFIFVITFLLLIYLTSMMDYCLSAIHWLYQLYQKLCNCSSVSWWVKKEKEDRQFRGSKSLWRQL